MSSWSYTYVYIVPGTSSVQPLSEQIWKITEDAKLHPLIDSFVHLLPVRPHLCSVYAA